MKKTLIPIALVFTLVAFAPAAFAAAAPQTAPLNLSATVINNCTITTTPVGVRQLRSALGGREPRHRHAS